MKLLLDTHLLLWIMDNSPKLSPAARNLLADPDTVGFASAASVWEIAVKHALGKLSVAPEALVPAIEASGIEPLPVNFAHASQAGRLPALHGDPFDRLLIAQSIVEGMRLMTADKALARYPTALVV